MGAHATCIQAAINGAGLACVFNVKAQELIYASKLESILDDWLAPFSGFYLYYSNRAYMPLKIRVFIGYLRENPGQTSPSSEYGE